LDPVQDHFLPFNVQNGKHKMTITLTTFRDQLENRLSDTANLIFSTACLDEAIRGALSDLSGTYGTALQLKDLDGADSTTFEEVDLHPLLVGATAYALRFRLYEKSEEAIPAYDRSEDLAKWATDTMNEFQALLTHIRLRRFYESLDHPYSQWEWDETSNG